MRRVVRSHGVEIGVRSNDRDVIDRAMSCMPTGWEESAAPGADTWFSVACTGVGAGSRVSYQLYREHQLLDSGFRLQRILTRLESAVRLTVGRLSPGRLFVHAGAVTWRNAAIILPGLSGTGKTTLVAALVRAGATYCSDEYAVFGDDGLLYPYTRPLSVRQGEHRRLHQNVETDLGGRLASGPVRAGLVASIRYRPLATWAPRTLSSGAGALTLFSSTLAARERPAFAFSVIARAMAGVVSLEGERGEAEAAADRILEHADTMSSFHRESSP
ncbi:MAG TPA: hypothetical protein VG916_07530 [Gemmatimonadaceae bacterium]|nr:hypothetical protein [Gemmatimonadaceae bacterium]